MVQVRIVGMEADFGSIPKGNFTSEPWLEASEETGKIVNSFDIVCGSRLTDLQITLHHKERLIIICRSVTIYS